MKYKTPVPFYVKQRSFVIPTKLKPLLEGYDLQTQRNLCCIVSKIIRESKDAPHLFVGISRKYWKNTIGSKYPEAMTLLKLWNVIEINDSYLSDGVRSYCKSYKLTPDYVKDAKVKVVFDIKSDRPLADHSIAPNKQTQWILNNLRRIGVREELVKSDGVIDEVSSEEYARKIWYGVFDMHYGAKCGRLYHSIINMPSQSRRNLYLKSNPAEPLYEYDIKSCMPVLMLPLCHDPAEKELYKQLLDKDIYSTVAGAYNVTKCRKDIKEDFMRFINGGKSNYFRLYLMTHFPVLLNSIKKVGEGMASYYQTSEASIMINTLPLALLSAGDGRSTKYCSTKVLNSSSLLTCGDCFSDLLYIPCHDGWISTLENEPIISQTVRDLFNGLTGYKITITRKNLTTGKETTL